MTHRDDKYLHYHKCGRKNIRITKITTLHLINLYVVLHYITLTDYYIAKGT